MNEKEKELVKRFEKTTIEYPRSLVKKQIADMLAMNLDDQSIDGLIEEMKAQYEKNKKYYDNKLSHIKKRNGSSTDK